MPSLSGRRGLVRSAPRQADRFFGVGPMPGSMPPERLIESGEQPSVRPTLSRKSRRGHRWRQADGNLSDDSRAVTDREDPVEPGIRRSTWDRNFNRLVPAISSTDGGDDSNGRRRNGHVRSMGAACHELQNRIPRNGSFYELIGHDFIDESSAVGDFVSSQLEHCHTGRVADLLTTSAVGRAGLSDATAGDDSET